MRIKDYNQANNIHPNDVLIIDGPEGTRAVSRTKIIPEIYEAEAWANGTMDGVDVPPQHQAYHNNAKYYAQNAENSAISANASKEAAAESEANASTSETNAAASETNAAASAVSANASKEAAAASAVSANASKEAAAASAASIAEDAAIANQNALKAEGIAVGEQNGSPVVPGSPYYNNNVKYYCEVAQAAAAGGIIPQGTCPFAELPALSQARTGDMWNISDSFVTTDDFREGPGIEHGAGANVYKTADNEWDVFEGKNPHNAMPLIAPVETSPSTHAYNKGDQLIYDDKLYKATRKIAIGDELSAIEDSMIPKTWNGLNSFKGKHIWTDGENIYYSYEPEQYVLDKDTSTWNRKIWNGDTPNFGEYIWTDGENIYYSEDSEQYVLDKATSTWNTKTWNGYASINGRGIWTDGENIYYSDNSYEYVLDKATSTWNTKTWNSLPKMFDGEYIWTDGENIYYSEYVSGSYVLNKATSTWNTKTWNGLNSFEGKHIWTDGENIYYSYESEQYVLDKATSTWNPKTWNGLTYFYGNNVWTDGDNIYYSSTNVFLLNNITLSDSIVDQIDKIETVNPVDYEEDIYGVNLIPYPYFRPSGYTTNGITFTVNSDGSITANGTSTNWANFGCVDRTAGPVMDIKINEQYILSGSPEGSSSSTYFVFIVNTQNGVGHTIARDYGDSATFTLPESEAYYGVGITIAPGITVNNLTFKPMLRKATIKDDTYRPFNEQSIQNQLTEQTNILGAKNWLKNNNISRVINGITWTVNADKTVTANGTVASDKTDSQFVIDFTFGDNSFLFNGSPNNENCKIYIWDKTTNARAKKSSGDPCSDSINNSDCEVFPVEGHVNACVLRVVGTVSNVTFKPMLRLASDPDNTYVPYAMTNRELTEKAEEIEGTIGNTAIPSGLGTTVTEAISNIDAHNHYSTSETWTGKYWTDGKKIYRKYLYKAKDSSNWFNISSNREWHTLVKGSQNTDTSTPLFIIADLNKIVNCCVFVFWGTSWYELPMYQISGNIQVYFSLYHKPPHEVSNQLSILCGMSSGTSTIDGISMWIEYTKTT